MIVTWGSRSESPEKSGGGGGVVSTLGAGGVCAEAANAAQEGSAVGRLDFLAQPEDVDIHSAVGHRAVMPPHSIQQLLAAEDHARATHEELEQPKFGGGE